MSATQPVPAASDGLVNGVGPRGTRRRSATRATNGPPECVHHLPSRITRRERMPAGPVSVSITSAASASSGNSRAALFPPPEKSSTPFLRSRNRASSRHACSSVVLLKEIPMSDIDGVHGFGGDQRGEAAAARLELGVGAALVDAPAVEHEDLVGTQTRQESMRHHEAGEVADAQSLLDERLRGGVE